MRKLFILSLFILIICVITLIRHYNKTNIKKYENTIIEKNKVLQNGKKTTSIYDSVYTKFKVRRSERNTINYWYFVNNIKYTHTKQMGLIPTTDTFTIFYLPENPNIHSENPQKEIEYAQNLLSKEKRSSPNLTWFFLVTSISTLLLSIVKIKRQINNQNELIELSKKYSN